VKAALANTDTDVAGCATMGEKLKVRAGAEIVVSIVVRDPSGTNYSPYTFANPSLAQVGISQPLNAPVLSQVDVVRGMVSGYRQPGAADYAGQWPNDWLRNPSMATVPAAAKNLSAAVLRTFNKDTWTPVVGNSEYKKMTFRVPAVNGLAVPAPARLQPAGQRALRDRCQRQPAGRRLHQRRRSEQADHRLHGGGLERAFERRDLHRAAIDGCPAHLPTVAGQKYVAYDVAAWSDLWFYSNPIFVEVAGAALVAGVK
jgi:hypothetical protein